MKTMKFVAVGEDLAEMAVAQYQDADVVKVETKEALLDEARTGKYHAAVIMKDEFLDDELREFRKDNPRTTPLFLRYDGISKPEGLIFE